MRTAERRTRSSFSAKALPPLRELPCGAADRENAVGGYSGLPVAVAAGSLRAEAAERCTLGCEEAMQRGQLQGWCRTTVRTTRPMPALAGVAGKCAAPIPVGRGTAMASARHWAGQAVALRATGAERRRREVERLEDGARRSTVSQEQDDRWVLARSHWLRVSEKLRKVGSEAAAPDGSVLVTRASEAARRKAAGARKAAEALLRTVSGKEQDARFAIVSEEQRISTRISLIGLRLQVLNTDDVVGTTIGVETDERVARDGVVDTEHTLRSGLRSIEIQSRIDAGAEETERLKEEQTRRARVWVEECKRREVVVAEEITEYASASAEWRAAADKTAQALQWRHTREEAEVRYAIEAEEAAAWQCDLPATGPGAATLAEREAREAGVPPRLLLERSETGHRRLLAREEEGERDDALRSEWRVVDRRALEEDEFAARTEIELDVTAACAVLLRAASGPAPMSRDSTATTTPGDEDELWAALDVALRPESRLSRTSLGSLDPDAEINAARREMLRRHYGSMDSRRENAAIRIQACWRGFRQWRDFMHQLYMHQLRVLRSRLRLRSHEMVPSPTGSIPDASGADLWAGLDELWDE